MFVAKPYVRHIRKSVAGNIPCQSHSHLQYFLYRTRKNIHLGNRQGYSRDDGIGLKVWGSSRQLASSDRARVWSPVGIRLIPLQRDGTTMERKIRLFFL